MTGPVSEESQQRAAVVFFLLAFLITWAIWIPRALGAEWAQEIGAVWTYGPALAAVAAALISAGRPGLRALGARVVRWRIGIRWYAVILLLPMAMALTEGAINRLLVGGSWSDWLPSVFTDPIGALILLVVLFLTDGLGEEVGWRGFALPRMLAENNALKASLVLGLVWAAWHLPLFWTDGSALDDTAIWALFVRLPAAAVIYTWLFRQTDGSVLAAALFHGAANLFAVPPPTAGASIVPALTSVAVTWVVAIVLVALAGSRRLDGWPATASAAGNGQFGNGGLHDHVPGD